MAGIRELAPTSQRGSLMFQLGIQLARSPERCVHDIQAWQSALHLVATRRAAKEINDATISRMIANQHMVHQQHGDSLSDNGPVISAVTYNGGQRVETQQSQTEYAKHMRASLPNLAWKQSLMLPSITLVEGMRVMLVTNMDIDSGLVNGSLGTVVGFTSPLQEAPWRAARCAECPSYEEPSNVPPVRVDKESFTVSIDISSRLLRWHQTQIRRMQRTWSDNNDQMDTKRPINGVCLQDLPSNHRILPFDTVRDIKKRVVELAQETHLAVAYGKKRRRRRNPPSAGILKEQEQDNEDDEGDNRAPLPVPPIHTLSPFVPPTASSPDLVMDWVREFGKKRARTLARRGGGGGGGGGGFNLNARTVTCPTSHMPNPWAVDWVPSPIVRWDLSGKTTTVPLVADEVSQPGIGSVTVWQYPLIPATAISIHKAQGLTIAAPQRVCVWGDAIFAPGMLYTAISRVQSPDQIAFGAFNLEMMQPHPRAAFFETQLMKQKEGEEEEEEAERDDA